MIDADPQRPCDGSATDEEKAKAWNKILEVRNFLDGRGWPRPVLADSGNGYHLLYAIDLPAEDGGIVKNVLRALAGRFDDGGVVIDQKVFDPPRLTKVYGTKGCKGQDTDDRPHRWTEILELPAERILVPREQLEELAAHAPPEMAKRPAPVGQLATSLPAAPTMPLDRKQQLAQAYLAKVPPAIQGQGGDKQTFTAACYLVKEFDLTVEQALPLLLEYNQRCVPPWNEPELIRKLEYAAKRPGERGRLLPVGGHNTHGPSNPVDPQPATSPASVPFVGVVPNFFQWDAGQMEPSPPAPFKDKRGRGNRRPVLSREWILDIVRHMVVVQRCNLVLLPDLYLAQLRWGSRDNWPANWRQEIGLALQQCYPDVLPVGLEVEDSEDGEQRNRIDQSKKWRLGEAKCYTACPLHGRDDLPHRHFRLILPERSLGVMKEFISERLGADYVEFDFRNEKWTKEEVKERKKELRADVKQLETYLEDSFRYTDDQEDAHKERVLARRELWSLRVGQHKVKGVLAAYLPVRLFGPSPQSGLTRSQCRLLAALTLQITRNPHANKRPDKAQILLVGGQEKGSATRAVPVCRFLEGGNWVLFNGNGAGKQKKLHGYGFKIRTWLRNAGYPDATEYPVILEDLRQLAGPFGLVIAGWNRTDREWKTLEDMLSLCGSTAGRKWLEGCVLRVYTRADYLVRWRSYFANQMGFSSIPGGEEDAPQGPTVDQDQTTIRTANDLQAWMARRGLTDGKLAGLLQVHRITINHYRSGRRRWRTAFQKKLDALLAKSKA